MAKSGICNRYVAGFFDGEGCVRIGKTTKHRHDKSRSYYDLNCRISQVNPEVLYLIQNRYGGNLRICKKPDGRLIPYWTICGTGALDFLRDILPHIIMKYEEVKVGIEFQEQVDSLRVQLSFSRKSPEGDRAYRRATVDRDKWYEDLKKLKDKGRGSLTMRTDE